ncbi:MAG TPA: hypothetical protein DCZ94_20810 [Lentisphaeria bacterium]|nr:MAG: hypothetical protein A2X48_09045 [Lentisphaerae bacterium GWF2_49_21]HBC89389.1 hypothetical protein [Lentisphaeria bacterium]
MKNILSDKIFLILRHYLLAGLLFAMFSFISPPASAQSPEKIDQEIAKMASESRNNAKINEVATKLNAIIAGKAASVKQKINAFNIIFDMYARNKRQPDAIAAAAKICESVPGSPEVRQASLVALINMHASAQQFDKAIENASLFIKEFPELKNNSAEVRVKLAGYYTRKKNFSGSLDEAEKAMSQIEGNDKLYAEALMIGMDAAAQSKKPEKELEFLTKLREDKYLKVRNQWEHYGIRMRYANAIRRTGKLDETIKYCSEMEKIIDNHPTDQRQNWCKMIADCLVEKKASSDEIIRQCEKVIANYPEVSNNWYSSQQMIVDAFTREKKFNEALGAAKIMFDASDDQWKREHSCRVVADLFKQLDGNDTRAMQFTDYQDQGPYGEDKQAGTQDDPKNPLAGINYPSYPEREKSFAKTTATCGDNAAASRHRGIMQIYTGHPRKALQYYIDGARRASCDDFGQAALDMIRIGAHSVRGYDADMEDFYRFASHGPNGLDCKAGTEDDIKDPFAVLLGAELKLSSGNGGMAGLSDADLKNLREVLGFLNSLASDQLTKGRDRRDVIVSIERIHEALLDWDGPEMRQWYMTKLSSFEKDDAEDALFNGLQLAARAGKYDLGAVQSLWKDLEAKSPGLENLVDPKTVTRCNMQWQKTLKMLNPPPKPKPKAKPKPQPKPQEKPPEKQKPPEKPKEKKK